MRAPCSSLGFSAFAAANLLGTQLSHDWARDDFVGIVHAAHRSGRRSRCCRSSSLALSNADPSRATAFAAYIQIMRLGGAEIGVALMGTWLRVREQIHSNYLGQHLENGSDNVTRMLKQLSDFFASHGAGTAPARALGTLVGAGCSARPTRWPISTAFGCASGWRWQRWRHGADHAGAAGPVHAGAVRLCEGVLRRCGVAVS